MVIRMSLALSFLLLLTVTAAAQIRGSTGAVLTGPLHDLTDARSTALGESWVARARTPSAWNSNPASLAGSVGIGMEYATRDIGGYSDYAQYGLGVWLSTPIGEFALNYREVSFTGLAIVFGNTFVDQYSNETEVIALSYATNMFSPIAIGTTIKRYNTSFAIDRPQIFSPSPGIYIDFGLMVSKKGFLNDDAGIDSLHGGVTIQNLGGNYEQNRYILPGPMGQFMRAGIGYDIGLAIKDKQPQVRASASVEYRRLLNPTDREKDEVDYAGAGIEITAYNLSARLGTVIDPTTSYFAAPHRPALRFGFGASLPLRKIGINAPVTLAADYAYMPSNIDYYPSKDPTMRNGMTMRVEYTEPLFK